MSRKAIASSLVWALGVGGLVALLNGERRAVSLRIWLAAFAIWFALAMMQRLFAEVPVATSRLRPIVRLRSRRSPPLDGRLRELRALESLILRARDNDRAYTQQLQPRLAALADHYLPMVHGIDRELEPERASGFLGDLGWLVDNPSPTRPPTLAEINELLDVLVDEPSANAGSPLATLAERPNDY